MDPTRYDPRPLYEQVADRLRQAISEGELKPGDQLPAEDELAERHQVSRQTIRRALQDLTSEGLVSSGRGRGRVVRAYQPLRWHLSEYESRHRHEKVGDQTADQWNVDVMDQGRKPSQHVEVVITVPPAHVAELLGIRPADHVVVRRRVRYVDDRPYQLADSYFPEHLVRDTPLIEPRDVSAPGGLLASIGHPQVRYHDEIKVRMPSKAEAEKLDLPTGTPIAEHIRTGYDANGQPLRVMVTVAPGDRHILCYELDAS